MQPLRTPTTPLTPQRGVANLQLPESCKDLLVSSQITHFLAHVDPDQAKPSKRQQQSSESQGPGQHSAGDGKSGTQAPDRLVPRGYSSRGMREIKNLAVVFLKFLQEFGIRQPGWRVVTHSAGLLAYRDWPDSARFAADGSGRGLARPSARRMRIVSSCSSALAVARSSSSDTLARLTTHSRKMRK